MRFINGLIVAVALPVFGGAAFAGAVAETPAESPAQGNGGRTACLADFDGSGRVDFADFVALAGLFGTEAGDANYNALMDLNDSGRVDFADFVAFAGVFGMPCVTAPASEDREALVALYNATDGPNWSSNTNWLSNRPLDEWSGVTTDDSGHVTILELYRAGLTGAIPPALGDLTNLEFLNLGWNELTGPIPSWLGSLTNLEVLNLGFNALKGPIPPALGSLTNLTSLDLSGNGLTGAIPSWLGSLTDLTVLRLGGNELTGPIPPELGNLTNLTRLRLSNNQLTGPIPPELGSLTNLTSLDLQYNGLTGAIPSWLGSLTNLTVLRLGDNALTGPIPPELGKLTKLKVLSLQNGSWVRRSSNALTGPIPQELGSLTNLTHLLLGGNALTGPIPSELGSLTNLTRLGLAENQLTGPIPGELGSLTNLTVLDLRDNALTGPIPQELGSLTNLTHLYLDNNSITDVSALSALTSLVRLDLNSNSITDLAPLVANAGLGAGDEIDIRLNPLSATSISVHVPAIEARGVSVRFDETIVFTDPRIYNGNVFVLPVNEDLAAGNLPLGVYATRFYGYFSDAFDFLIFFVSLTRDQLDSDAFKGAFYAGVANDVKGIGQSNFFNSDWGSAGKLQGGVFFPYVSGRSPDHSLLVQGPMLHELMHRWANFIVDTSGGAHWGFSSANGILGGFDIATLEDYGSGRYGAADVNAPPGRNFIAPYGWAGNLKPYSPIELYLAGLIPPEEVPDLWVAEDGDVGDHEARDRVPFVGNRVKTYTIEDFIAKHGPRVPNHTQAQKDFRAAVILLVSKDYPATRQNLEALSNDASLFSYAGEDQHEEWYNFYEATGGRATIAMDGLSQFQSRAAAKRVVPRSYGTPPPPIVCHGE